MFQTKIDKTHRADTGYFTPSRIVFGLLSSFVLFLISPFFLIKVYLEEQRIGIKKPTSFADSAHGSMELYPICVIPLAEFGRLGASISLAPNADNRFVLIQHVTFDINRTQPVGESLDPSFKPPLESHPHLRLVSGGFITDFASIPLVLRKIAGSPFGSYSRAAVVHDWAYANHFDGTHAGRKDCDRAILSLMRDDGTEPWRRALIYVGLRIGGGLAFREAPYNQEELIKLYTQENFSAWYMHANTMLLTFLGQQLEGIGVLEKGWTAQTNKQIQHAAMAARNQATS